MVGCYESCNASRASSLLFFNSINFTKTLSKVMFKGTEEVDWLPGRHVRIVLVVYISITGRYQKGI